MKIRFFDAFFALCVLFLLANLLIAVSACSNDESVRVIDDVILDEQGQAALSQGDSLKQGTKPNEVCDSANEGKKLETYGPGHNEKYGGDEHYYKCLANEWKEIEQVQYECEDETPKVGDKCVYHGGSVYFGSTYYAYFSDTGWVNINAIEYTFGFCTNEKESQVVNHEWYGDYICKSGKWTAVTEEAASED